MEPFPSTEFDFVTAYLSLLPLRFLLGRVQPTLALKRGPILIAHRRPEQHTIVAQRGAGGILLPRDTAVHRIQAPALEAGPRRPTRRTILPRPIELAPPFRPVDGVVSGGEITPLF